jgi:RNA polymerase sigma factor (sigma-70 family)
VIDHPPEPWRASLDAGHPDVAWQLFLERYRALLLATVRRMVPREADRTDAFAYVCEALSAQELARLRRFRDGGARPARFTTWLVTVVHNQLVDWLRRCNGRPRITPPATLSTLQQRIFACVFGEGRSHVEAYELLRPALPDGFSFSAFLRELAETYRIVELARPNGVMHYLASRPEAAVDLPGADPAPDHRLASSEARARLASALRALPDDERLALRLYVIESLPAADVARTLGWAGAKTVYNRVYRGLSRVRAALERDGLGSADL